ncbi:hypothetical protein B0I03_103351 [Flavobacterium aquaticum]|uniref:Uncharacterized protein n=1 Tax=Flavobacterium aquaticum TaxID=1236486 RepID=A0A327YSI5_9FLAO|nr:hypothetical protein [Flavobacterium aquaticum]RAK23883.1 hypothetical protein B0I03_103351 [Flavobacterium aquaticum]
MKKRVSAELISIAHRILKLKNHSETVQLQQEAKNLYDQLTILRFYEENFELVKNEISEEVLAEKLEGKPTEVFDAPIQDKIVETPEEVKIEVAPEEEETIAEPIAEEKVVIAELIVEDDEEEEEVLMTPMEEEPIEEEIIEEEPVADSEVSEPKTEEPAKQISFEDLLVHDYQELDFVKVEDVPAEVEKVTETVFEAVTPVEEVKEEVQPEPVADSETSEPKVLEEEVKATFEKVSQEPKISSLNDRLNKAITFGLNDRIGFEKKLFGGSSDDFNRVISQLNTFDSFEEAKAFVDDFVKPDYNNWEGAEEFETRFMEIVEKKFS